MCCVVALCGSVGKEKAHRRWRVGLEVKADALRRAWGIGGRERTSQARLKSDGSRHHRV